MLVLGFVEESSGLGLVSFNKMDDPQVLGLGIFFKKLELVNFGDMSTFLDCQFPI